MNIIVLTGAGISADSGVPTFRDNDGVWAKFDWQRLASPEAFAADPNLVHEFYNHRRAALSSVAPNAAHAALVALERACAKTGAGFTLVTQNVDNLHQRAGSRAIIPMHGELTKARRVFCAKTHYWEDSLGIETICPACEKAGGMRPNIVWFGEMPMGLSSIDDAMAEANLFCAIGTSGTVYPAAGFAATAKACGIRTVLINRDPPDNDWAFDECRTGRAVDCVPEWSDGLIQDMISTSS